MKHPIPKSLYEETCPAWGNGVDAIGVQQNVNNNMKSLKTCDSLGTSCRNIYGTASEVLQWVAMWNLIWMHELKTM